MRRGTVVVIIATVVVVAVVVLVARFTAERERASSREARMSSPQRVLVLLSDASSADDVRRLQGQYKVLSLLPPRILVLDLDRDQRAALGREADVRGIFDTDVPASVRDGLRPEERLFIAAWVQQQLQREKTRPGEGLPWDAPGFQPPDKPPVKRRP